MITNNLSAQKITWKEGQKLNWNNFKSKINNQKGKNVVAYTNCGWVYSYVKSSNPKAPVKIEIKTIFNEHKSWKDSEKINDFILTHEQKHFDIAEIFARKLRKEVAERVKTSGDFNRLFQGIYDRVLKEYTQFQMSYDQETEHGMDKEKQEDYNVLISNELENLKNYKTS
ncbi:DUF922 domain-containing protein [uncultured Chryseobacterium sp.]|uniref:DUF922 domain-containing protein n=1 Tax=uncultured Chryseobacterium sp. TaxID=259322 RepID=UPI00261686A4|nr:DUF922 domain-containing protein [uncultured Chryseobacterium sp.]